MRVRKPFYRSARDSWYYNAKLPDGRYQQVELSKDRDEAFRIWEEHYRPIEVEGSKHQPVGVREVIVTREVTNPKTTQPSEQSESKAIASSPKPCNVRGRYAAFERMMLVAELLIPLRRGATVDELHRDSIALLGRAYSKKTILRDLSFFCELGIAIYGKDSRYKWNASSPRARPFEPIAEAIAG